MNCSVNQSLLPDSCSDIKDQPVEGEASRLHKGECVLYRFSVYQKTPNRWVSTIEYSYSKDYPNTWYPWQYRTWFLDKRKDKWTAMTETGAIGKALKALQRRAKKLDATKSEARRKDETTRSTSAFTEEEILDLTVEHVVSKLTKR